MPRKKFSDEQIAFALRQAETGTPGGEICRKMVIAEATFSRWKKVYAGMGVSETRNTERLIPIHARFETLERSAFLRRSLILAGKSLSRVWRSMN